MQQRRRSTGDFSAIDEAANSRVEDEGGKESTGRGLRADSAHYSMFASSTSSSSIFLMKRSEDIPALEEGLAGDQVSLDMKETSQCMRAHACDNASDLQREHFNLFLFLSFSFLRANANLQLASTATWRCRLRLGVRPQCVDTYLPPLL